MFSTYIFRAWWLLLKNHIMKYFQVKHGWCGSIIFSKRFSFESSKALLDLCFADRRILYFWQVLESILKFIIELHVLQCLFVSWSNKKQRKSRIISIFTKKETFSSLITTKLLGVISQWGCPSLTPQKRPSSPLQVGKKRIYLCTQLKGELTDLFWKLPNCSLFLQAW